MMIQKFIAKRRQAVRRFICLTGVVIASAAAVSAQDDPFALGGGGGEIVQPAALIQRSYDLSPILSVPVPSRYQPGLSAGTSNGSAAGAGLAPMVGGGLGGMGGGVSGGGGMFSAPAAAVQRGGSIGGAIGGGGFGYYSNSGQDYPAGLLLEDVGEMGGMPADGLVELIQMWIGEDEWEDMGGETPGRSILAGDIWIVWQTEANHEAIAAVLKDLANKALGRTTWYVVVVWVPTSMTEEISLSKDLPSDQMARRVTEAGGYAATIRVQDGHWGSAASGGRQMVVTNRLPLVGQGTAAYNAETSVLHSGFLCEVQPTALPEYLQQNGTTRVRLQLKTVVSDLAEVGEAADPTSPDRPHVLTTGTSGQHVMTVGRLTQIADVELPTAEGGPATMYHIGVAVFAAND